MSNSLGMAETAEEKKALSSEAESSHILLF